MTRRSDRIHATETAYPKSYPRGRPAIFLSPLGGGRHERRPPPLARLLGLDVWGTSLLNLRARHEMAAAATVLVIVFLFELTAWSVLFNVIVHGAAWTIGWRTLLAVILGFVLASAVFVFERGILTTDTSPGRGRARFATALCARLGLIFLSALATSQPVELLVFGAEIDERLRDEAARAEAIRQLQELKDDRDRLAQSPLERANEEVTKSDLGARLERANEAVTQERGEWKVNEKLAALQARMEALPAEIARLRGQIRAIHVGDPPDSRAIELRRKLQVKLDTSIGEQNSLPQLIAIEKHRDEQAHKPLADALAEKNRAEEAVRIAVEKEAAAFKQERTDFVQRERERREWIRTILRAPVGQPLPASTPSGVHPDAWDPYRAGFVQRHSLLAEMRGGKLPAWPAIQEDARKEATGIFGIADIQLDDKDTAERLALRAADFERIYWIAFCIALVVPILTLMFKLLLARELRLYYSTDAQAGVGNPEAEEVVEAERALELRSAGRGSGPGQPRDAAGDGDEDVVGPALGISAVAGP